MKNPLTRIVALFLIPGLLLDPAFAMPKQLHGPLRCSDFGAQAFEPPLIASQHAPSNRMAAGVASQIKRVLEALWQERVIRDLVFAGICSLAINLGDWVMSRHTGHRGNGLLLYGSLIGQRLTVGLEMKLAQTLSLMRSPEPRKLIELDYPLYLWLLSLAGVPFVAPREDRAVKKLPHLEAIQLYSQAKGAEQHKIYRVMRLLEQLSRAVEPVVAPILELNNDLATALLPRDSSERTYDQFRAQILYPRIDEFLRHSKLRFLIGSIGKQASGKTTLANRMVADLAGRCRDRTDVRVRPVHGDDFTLERKEWADPDSIDPYIQYDILKHPPETRARLMPGRETMGYVDFMENLAKNVVAVKGLYDTKTHGQIKFGAGPAGSIIVYNGKDTRLEIQIGDDGSVSAVHTASTAKGPAVMPWTEDRNWAGFAFGSLPGALEPWKGGVIFRLNETEWLMERKADGLFVTPLDEASRPQKRYRRKLGVDQRTEALEVWKPVGEGREIIIAEGALSLEAEAVMDLTLSEMADFIPRRRRAVERARMRGRYAEIEATASRVTARLYEAGDVVNRLMQRAAENRGVGRTPQTHFLIDGLSVPEHVILNSLYHAFWEQQMRFFLARGIDLPDKYDLMWRSRGFATEDAAKAILLHAAFPLRQPKPFLGKASAEADRPPRAATASDRFITLGLEGFLILQYENTQNPYTTLRPETRAELEATLARSLGITVGAALARDLGVRVDYEDAAGRHDNVPLSGAFLMNQVPLMESVLADVQTLEEGRRYIDAFIDTQWRMWDRGLLDGEPDIARHYGRGFHMNDEERVLSTNFESLARDGDAIGLFKKIVARQNASPLPAGYDDIPGYYELAGYQKQFVFNPETDEDYLARIPAMFRPYFVEQIGLRVPRDLRELKGLKQFGHEWNTAVLEGRQQKFRNTGVSLAVIDDYLIASEEGTLERLKLKRLETEFDRRLALLRGQGTPPLAWISAFVRSLTPISDNRLYTLAATLLWRLASEPDWMNRCHSASGACVTAAVMIEKGLYHVWQRHYRELTGLETELKNWEKELLSEVIGKAAHLPPTWEKYDEMLREGA